MANFSEKLDDFLIRNFAYFNYKNYVRELNLQGNEKVLEVGSGGGNLSRFLAEKVRELICIDKSSYWIEKSKKRLKGFKNIKFEISDLLDFNKEDYFNVAIIHYVLHDINKKNRLKTIKILKDKLEKNGKIYIREPTRKNHGMPAKEIEDLMLSSGLKKIFSREIYSLPLRAHYMGGFEKK